MAAYIYNGCDAEKLTANARAVSFTRRFISLRDATENSSKFMFAKVKSKTSPALLNNLMPNACCNDPQIKQSE